MSAIEVLSPTPPVECLSTLIPSIADRSNISPLCAIAIVKAAVSSPELESFQGFTTGISSVQFMKQVNDIGISIMGQTLDIAPADKKLYALRDVTATVAAVYSFTIKSISSVVSAKPFRFFMIRSYILILSASFLFSNLYAAARRHEHLQRQAKSVRANYRYYNPPSSHRYIKGNQGALTYYCFLQTENGFVEAPSFTDIPSTLNRS